MKGLCSDVRKSTKKVRGESEFSESLEHNPILYFNILTGEMALICKNLLYKRGFMYMTLSTVFPKATQNSRVVKDASLVHGTAAL